MAMDPSWYLRKYEGGGIFGPLPFDQLSRWASKARVAPRDLVSSDQENWMKAPMLLELGMDWLVEVTSERYYGPTTLGAINEFVRLGDNHRTRFQALARLAVLWPAIVSTGDPSRAVKYQGCLPSGVSCHS